MVQPRVSRYRLLSTMLGDVRARRLIDRLQVMAMTEPDTLREMEKFLDHGDMLKRYALDLDDLDPDDDDHDEDV